MTKTKTETKQKKMSAVADVKIYDVIQKTRPPLTDQEQKLILLAASKVRPIDCHSTFYCFDLRDFISVCEIQGNEIEGLKMLFAKVAQKSWWVETRSGAETVVRWFHSVCIDEKKGVISIQFDIDIMCVLLKLAKTGSPSVVLQYILPMSRQYSPLLYELLWGDYDKALAGLKECHRNFEIEDLKQILDCQNYKNFNDFKRFALDPAIDEINRYSNINVTYDLEKEGRKVVRVKFFMAAKEQDALLNGQEPFERVLAKMQHKE